MDKLLTVLKGAGVEVTEELKTKIKDAMPSGEGKFTQDEVDDIIDKRMAKVKAKHEKELKKKDQLISNLKKQTEELVDPEKVEEYEETVKELEQQAKQQTLSLTKQYELKLAAKDAGVEDAEYIEFLMEKRGMTDKLTVSDDEVVVTDEEGNVITNEDGEKLGPEKLIADLKKDKPELFDDTKKNIGKKSNPGGDGKTEKNPWKPGQVNLMKQSEIMKENSKLAKTMIEEAGLDPADYNL